MHNGEQQTGPSTVAHETVDTLSQPTLESIPTGSSNTPPEVVITPGQEERVRVLKRIEQSMDNFRNGLSTRFQVLTNLIDELDKWSNVTDEDRERALNTYMAEINASTSIPNDNRQVTQPTRSSPPPIGLPKRRRPDVDDLVEQLSRGENDEAEDESGTSRKRAREEDMPWYTPIAQTTRREICIKTLRNPILPMGQNPQGRIR
jgi:hypothetical protein